MAAASNPTISVNLDHTGMVAIFGKEAAVYGKIVSDIASDLAKDSYRFEDLDDFEINTRDAETGMEHAGRVYWTEILYRAHMASVAAVFRTTRWIEVAIREYEARSLYGCASACRSLIESAGDIGLSLGPVAYALADNKDALKVAINGKATGPLMISQELEDSLIHFTHARQVTKSEEAPESHKAMPSYKYIDYVDKMKVADVQQLYARLCEIVHPAAESVSVTFVLKGDAWIVDPFNERTVLQNLLVENRGTLSGVVMASYNAPLLILKTLHSFDLFTKLSGLRKYRFDAIPAWSKIEAMLRS